MFNRIIFLFAIVSSLSCNLNQCAVCFQPFMNIACQSYLLIWEPQRGHPNRGRPRTTYIDTITADTGLDNEGRKEGRKERRKYKGVRKDKRKEGSARE